MNCALLLVATSVCAWADPAPTTSVAPPPATAIVAPPVAGCSGCATPCASCNECKPGFLDRLRAKFAHHSDCGCAPAPVHVKACNTCNTCNTCEPSLFERLKAAFPKKECGCAPAPTPCYYPAPTCHQATACGCGESWKPGFLDKLKARFAHNECGCTTCASPCGATPYGSTVIAPVITAPGTKPMDKPKEIIPPPAPADKLPPGTTPPGKEISTSSLRLDPVAPNSNPIPDPF